MLFELFLFSVGIILGVIPCLCYGKYGGDEKFCDTHPHLKRILKYVHHAYIGVFIVFLGLLFPFPINILMFGWGTSTAMDDLMFHNFENYFERKRNKDNNPN